MCLSDHNSAKRKVLHDISNSGCLWNFRNGFWSWEEIREIVDKKQTILFERYHQGPIGNCGLFDDVDDDDTDHNVKSASLTSVYLGMLVVSSRSGGGLEPPTTLFHLPAPPPRKKPPTRGDKQPHSEHKGW